MSAVEQAKQAKSQKQDKEVPEEPEIIEQRANKVSGSTIVKRYEKGRFLGKGGFAKCYEATNLETNKLMAIKIVSKQTLKKSKAKQKLVMQIKIHKSLEHKHIVTFDHVFEDPKNVYILLGLCGNHTLDDMIKKRKRISQLQVQYFMGQIIDGLTYLHGQKVIHRDLKLGNLLLSSNMQIKIGDFGLAAKLESNTQKRRTICGTPNYLAPEIISNIGHSYEVDIWSLGVIMFALLYGRPPFETSQVKKTYKKIKQCQYAFNDDISVSYNAKNLISRILVVDASKRLTLQQILTHPFMSSCRLPRELPISVLTSPLPRSYIQQHTFGGGNINKQNSLKSIQKTESSQCVRFRTQKGIVDRLMMCTSGGYARSTLSKVSQQQNYQQSTMHTMNNNMPSSLCNNYLNRPESVKDGRQQNSVYVKKWVDYSSKYGLGYLLSDGTTGIYFNDSTKMSLDESGQNIDYISTAPVQLLSFKLNDPLDSKQLTKKITLMQYFRKYLHGSSANQTLSDKRSANLPLFYVKKWAKSEEAILFRLSNKIVQVNFNDKTQLVLYCDRDLLLYAGHNGKDKQVMSMSSGEYKKNHELMSRLEHAKTLLRRITTATQSCETNKQFDQLQVTA